MAAERAGNAGSYALALASHLFFGHGEIPWAEEMLEQAGIEHERRKIAGKQGGAPKHGSIATSNATSNTSTNAKASLSSLSLSVEGESEGKQESPQKSELELQFDEVRKLYPGTHKGFDYEWENFLKKHGKRKREIVPLLLPALAKFCRHHSERKTEKQYIPHFTKWINNQGWTEEYPTVDFSPNTAQKPSGDFTTMTEAEKREWKRQNVV